MCHGVAGMGRRRLTALLSMQRCVLIDNQRRKVFCVVAWRGTVQVCAGILRINLLDAY